MPMIFAKRKAKINPATARPRTWRLFSTPFVWARRNFKLPSLWLGKSPGQILSAPAESSTVNDQTSWPSPGCSSHPDDRDEFARKVPLSASLASVLAAALRKAAVFGCQPNKDGSLLHTDIYRQAGPVYVPISIRSHLVNLTNAEDQQTSVHQCGNQEAKLER